MILYGQTQVNSPEYTPSTRCITTYTRCKLTELDKTRMFGRHNCQIGLVMTPENSLLQDFWTNFMIQKVTSWTSIL